MKKKRCLSVVIISLLLGISCFIMAGCANKDNEDKDDTKIEQNLDKKEDAEDFNKKDEEADELCQCQECSVRSYRRRERNERRQSNAEEYGDRRTESCFSRGADCYCEEISSDELKL